MAGFIGTWGPREDQLHPRGFHGRFIRKFNIPEILPRILKMMDAAFHPRSFGSQGQASQYLFNQGKPGRFGNGVDYRRLHFDFDEANAHLQQGEIDPSTQRYVDMMERNATTLPDDIITAQSFTPETLGMTPEQMNEPGGDFNGLIGAVIADRGYSAVHVGASPNHGPGQILLTIATPKGTRVIVPGRNRNDSGLFLDRDQPLLVTSVSPDGRGGWYMMAVAMPIADLSTRRSNQDVPNLAAPRGAGLTPQQREERIGAPQAPDARAQRAGTPPPLGAGGQVTGENVNAPEQPAPPSPAPAQAAPSPPASPAPVGRGQPPPRNEPVHSEAVGGTGGAEGKTATEIAQTPAEQAPGSPPESVAAPAPQAELPNEHVARVRQKAEVKRQYRQMAIAVPVADVMQEVDELTHKKQDNKVVAQHIRGIMSDPVMEEVPKDERERLTQRMGEAADLFEAGKVNQGRQRLASLAREMDLSPGDKPGSKVDFDPSTMDSVSDVPDGSQVEIIRPSVIHTDPDTGKETVISKGRVRPIGGAAPETGAPDRQGGVVPEPGPTNVEAPSVPEAAPAKKVAKKAAGPAPLTPNEERVVERAKEWRGHERNDEERRIVAQADAIEARQGKKSAPAPERAPRTGRAPMAKKAAPAKAAPTKAAPAAAPEKAAPRKLTGDRDAHTKTARGIIQEANQDLADGRGPGQVAEDMREKADALLTHGEPLDTDGLVNPGRLEHSDEDLRDITRGDASLIDRMADDLEKQEAPAAVKKAAPEAPKKVPAKKAEPKKAPDLLAEREARKLELAKRQGERERIAKEKAAERTRVAEEKKAAATKAKEDRAAARAAAPKKVPAKKAEAKDLTPEQRAAAEVQDRADEAGLPGSVTELRAAAKEQGIKGFSTMRKEQLQRALLGEDVSTGSTKLQVVSPEKMVGHLERVDTDSAARTLLEKHTLADLKALADQVGIDHKGQKLTTKDKLKTAILHEVRGAPGTDFEPVSPDEAVSIRDVKVPDGTDGDMLRRGLVEVDDTDPESLRDESERLESHATQLRQKGDRVNAALYQDAADRMGMRAQQISGMEEVPKPAKRAPRKAAAPKATAAGTAAAIRAAPDVATAREALKGKTAVELKAIATEVGAPHGASWTKARIENSIVEHGVQRRLDGDAIARTDIRTPAVKKAAAGPRVPGSTPRLGLEPGPESTRQEHLAELRDRQAALAGIREAVANGGSDKAIENTIVTHARTHNLSDEDRDSLLKGLREGKLDDALARLDQRQVSATRARKTVAPGSVPGPRAQAPISNPQRASSFVDAVAGAGLPDRGARPAQRTIDEVVGDVEGGKLSPEEGIRRLETDIDLNKLDLAEMDAQLRGDLSPEDRATIKAQHGELKADIDAQEKASKFMRGHFRKEPEVTAEEAKAALAPEQRHWLDGADAEEVRDAARQAGLGEVSGDTAQEVFKGAVQKAFQQEREAKAAKKATKAAKKALPKAEPKVDPENPDRLEVRQIGTGIDFKEEDAGLLKDVQRRLDAGESPAAIGTDLDGTSALSPRARRTMLLDLSDLDARIADAKEQGLPADQIRDLEERKATIQASIDRLGAQSVRQEELARRLQAMRPAKKTAAPTMHPAMERMLRTGAAPLPGKPRTRLPEPKPSKELPPLAPSNADLRAAREKATAAQNEFNDAEERLQRIDEDTIDYEDALQHLDILRDERTQAEKDLADVLEAMRAKPAAPAPTKARRVGPGGSSFPADMPAEEQARRVAQIEKRQAPEVQAAKKETAEVQARLLTTAIERLEAAKTEAQVRDAVKGLTMPELKTVAGKYPLARVGRSKESLTKALVDFHTNRANFEVLTRGGHRENPIEAGNFSDKPTIPNNWGTNAGDVSFHPDGPVGQALAGLGPEAKLNVDGDSLENVVGKLATRSVRGQISAEQFIDELKSLRTRLPEGNAKKRLGSAIEEIDTPKREPLPLPEGTPAPLVELMQMFSGMPLARQTPRRGRESAMDELKKIAEELGQRPNSRLIQALQTRLHNNIHESYGAEGAFELDRAVRRAIEQLRELGRRPS